MADILIIFFLLVLNGLFAMSEIALVSSRRSRLEQKAKEGNNSAKIALKLLEDPEKFLSTVQIGITLVGIIAGAYGGEQFTQDVRPLFENVAFLKPYSEELAFALVVGVITYFTLIIGELVPKSIALNNPENITIALARFMRILAFITYPFVALLSLSTKLILKIFRIKENKEPPVTEEELKYLIEVGSKHGILEKQESEIMQEVIRFTDRKAESIMTPRGEIEWIDVNKSKNEIFGIVKSTQFTKFPVCSGKIDDVIGIVTVKDIFLLADSNKPFDIRTVVKEPIFIPEGLPVFKVLDMFRKKRFYIGIVVNEYGDTEGLITLTNLVENIIGELTEVEIEKPEISLREDGSWLCDADVKIDDIKSALGLKKLPGEHTYSTLAGFIMFFLRKVPVTGESFVYSDYLFEVIDMDKHRIDKVLIKKNAR